MTKLTDVELLALHDHAGDVPKIDKHVQQAVDFATALHGAEADIEDARQALHAAHVLWTTACQRMVRAVVDKHEGRVHRLVEGRRAGVQVLLNGAMTEAEAVERFGAVMGRAMMASSQAAQRALVVPVVPRDVDAGVYVQAGEVKYVDCAVSGPNHRMLMLDYGLKRWHHNGNDLAVWSRNENGMWGWSTRSALRGTDPDGYGEAKTELFAMLTARARLMDEGWTAPVGVRARWLTGPYGSHSVEHALVHVVGDGTGYTSQHPVIGRVVGCSGSEYEARRAEFEAIEAAAVQAGYVLVQTMAQINAEWQGAA